MKNLKKILPDLVAIAIFAVLSVAYFMPADMEGRILYQHDASAGRGSGQEIKTYNERTGKTTRWTNSLFGGMPTYQLAPSYGSGRVLGQAIRAYHLWLPDYVWYVFAYLLGFYILLRAFDFRQYLAVLGSVLWAFSSYFFIIIAAGHIWKVWALAYLPPMIAGLVLAYRGKYFWGFVVTAVFTAFEVAANHVQMTYYYLFVMLLMVVGWLAQAIREHRMGQWWRASAVALAAGAIGITINLSNLYHTWQYSQESMRGKSELVKKNTANQTSSGLDRDYITQWSYGVDETWTLLVPNAKGGASVPMSLNDKAMAKADPQFMPIYQQLGQYWGEQPGTSGPVYVGAFVLTLFFLGLFVVRGPMKWALLAATVLSIVLSWGRNCWGPTNFFIDHVPMYAKFRTVASILVIAEFTIPLLAMLALRRVVEQPECLGRRMRWLWVSFALTGGVALAFWAMPSLFFPDYISQSENQALSQIPAEYLAPLRANITAVRQYIFTSDAMRSFIVVLAGTAIVWLMARRKLDRRYAVAAITLLCLVDMWTVNKRYLNDAMFVEQSVRDTPQPMTATDTQILRDKTLNYRVLNLASNTFNENETSYYHHSIGGYHAAKLRRYQEMIDRWIQPEMRQLLPALQQAGGDMTRVDGDKVAPVLDMLNTRYFIIPLQGGQTVPIQNPYAMGNAWMVDRVDYVGTANDEIDRTGRVDLHHVAVADRRFSQQLGNSTKQGSVSIVKLTAYEPNHLTYQAETDKGGVAVFSEVYYPGWTATIDGKPAELGRVNYILRALRLPAGRHRVELDFHPASIRRTETAAYSAEALLVVLIALGLWRERRKRIHN